ncbi:MAG: hypothetical protein LQ344_007865 [Seirophora lacunosa]|nr:MAG: hypothetical protein LQ344_007865 [Seirophora lacunosa]
MFPNEPTLIKTSLFPTIQSNRTNNNNHLSPPTALILPPDIRILHYTVPETNVDLEFILFLRDPVDPPAFKQAIWQGVAAVRDHIIDHGDGWLVLGRDDPYYSTVPGRCVVKIDSRKTESGRSSLTYKTLLAAFVGLWNRLYVEGEEWEGAGVVRVGGTE